MAKYCMVRLLTDGSYLNSFKAGQVRKAKKWHGAYRVIHERHPHGLFFRAENIEFLFDLKDKN